MLNVSLENISLGCKANNKDDVLSMIAKKFKDKGYVNEDILKDLQQREKEISTYLGNGVVVPHLPISSRHKVINPGIEIFQFPEGVVWDRKIMFIAIGVAPKEKEHIKVIKNIATLFSDELTANALSMISDKEEFSKIINN